MIRYESGFEVKPAKLPDGEWGVYLSASQVRRIKDIDLELEDVVVTVVTPTGRSWDTVLDWMETMEPYGAKFSTRPLPKNEPTSGQSYDGHKYSYDR